MIDEAIAVLGGEKFLAIKERTESGRAYSFFREQLSGLAIATIYTRYLDVSGEAPGSVGLVERQDFGKEAETSVLFNRQGGYEIFYRGVRPIAKERLERFRDSVPANVFYILRQRLKEPGLIVEGRGAEVFQNQPVEIVEITDSTNRVVTVYFHRSTKLPVRQLFYRRDPLTRDRIEEVTLFAKYRDAGGVQWPFNVLRERDGEKIFELFAESVTMNPGLSDDLFELPKDKKMLPAAR